MSKSCFEEFYNLISEFEQMKKFEISQPEKDKILLKKENQTYEIFHSASEKRIVLRNDNANISTWLFDDENLSKKDLNMIAQDFAEALNQSTPKTAKNAKKKCPNDESNVTGLFFANRMVNIFPEIKDDIYIEKECYSEFRAVTFTKEILIPKINNLLSNPKANHMEIKKLGKLLSDLYSNASLDVRSIITIGLLNNLNNEAVLQNFLSDELKKAWQHALKYKGKKVKPEKQKKKASFMSKALEYQREGQNQKK